MNIIQEVVSIFQKAVEIYKESSAYQTTIKDLENGATLEDDNFLQGVSDNAYSVLSKVLTEDEMEELEVLEVVEAAINS